MGAEVGPGLAGAAQEGVPILCAGCRLGVWLRFSRGRDAELAQWARAELATGWKGLPGWAAAASSG